MSTNFEKKLCPIISYQDFKEFNANGVDQDEATPKQLPSLDLS